MSTDSWSRWWADSGKRAVCVLLLRHWDVIGVEDIDEQPGSEYTFEATRVGELLRDGASAAELQALLSDLAAELSVHRDAQRDAAAAVTIVSWYTHSAPHDA